MIDVLAGASTVATQSGFIAQSGTGGANKYIIVATNLNVGTNVSVEKSNSTSSKRLLSTTTNRYASTADYTLTIPLLTVNYNTSFELAKITGNVYIAVAGCQFIKTQITGNVYFASAAAQSGFYKDGSSSISGTQTVGNPNITPTPTPAPVAVVGVDLSRTTAALKVPASLQLTATVYPTNASNLSVTWTSSNLKVATVDAGNVVAKGPGVATITVTTADGAFTNTCKVTVTQPVFSVKLNKFILTLAKGKTSKLIATVLPANASNKKVTWKSSSPKIATVTSAGVVKGIKKGTAYITATTVLGKKIAICKVTVK